MRVPVLCAIWGLIAFAAAMPARAERFTFMAIGDMPYSIPDDLPRFERLIARLNALRPAFTVHVGDIKSGSTPCTDESYRLALDRFALFEQPLVYTPGDNEWTDCHRAGSGGHDPLERLARIRTLFFPDPRASLGRTRLALESQAADPQFAAYVENARWERAGVVFATLHVVGSNNNLQRDRAAVLEHLDRNAANLAWLDATFDRARAIEAKAVVLAFQAQPRFEREPPDADQRSGYNDLIRALKRHAMAFRRPVLMIHGDYHTLLIDRPLIGPKRVRILNATRLMVPGDKEVHGVQVEVDTANPDPFSFRPIMVPENMPDWRVP